MEMIHRRDPVGMNVERHIAGIRGEANRRNQLATLRAVARELELDAVEQLQLLEANDWDQLRALWADEGRSASNIRYRSQTVARYLRSCGADELVLSAIRKSLPPTNRSGTGRMLDATEIDRLVGLPLISRQRRLTYAMFWIQTTMGVRRAELIGAKLHHYDEGREQLRVRDAKTLADRWLWLPGPVRIAVALHRADPAEESEYILRQGNGQPIPEWHVNKMYEEAADAVGVERFTSHDLRRTCASTLLERGVDVATVSRILGHTNMNTTRAYDRRPHAAQDRAQRKLVASIIHRAPQALVGLHRQLLTTERKGRIQDEPTGRER